MAPILHCVRHAQGYHNLDNEGAEDIRNPELTPRGRDQCLLLRDVFPRHDQVQAVVASPIRRTIQTALLGFQPAFQRGLRVILLPQVQETSAKPSDTGANVEDIKERFKNEPVDFHNVPPGWNTKAGKWEPTSEGVKGLASEARQWLRAREESEIVLVTHGSFLHFFTQDWTDNPDGGGNTAWMNTEFRTYEFSSGLSAELYETKDSVQRRSDKASGGAEAQNANEDQTEDIERRQARGEA